MKKFAVLIAVVLVAALAAPALSATNPFMDVPMNHWAYDAIGQLAAHGIISGYPDGTYKGQLTTTRYELASALARSLAVVDMTKASKQDVEMLKRLVVEFKDELEALGVRVDELDERVAVYENRLGGWHLHGTLAVQIDYDTEAEAPTPAADVKFDEARIWFERTWGENDQYQFFARLRNEGDGNGNTNSGGKASKFNDDNKFETGKDGYAAYIDRFWVDMPFFFDSKMTIGRFSWNWEGNYLIDLHDTGSWGGDSIMTDWVWTGFGFTKNFGLGQAQAVIAHPDHLDGYDMKSSWMLMLGTNLQFTEQIGFDFGAQYFAGDNAETFSDPTARNGLHVAGDKSYNSMWTIFAGLRFNWNDNVAFKGIFYSQANDYETVYIKNANGANGPVYDWKENDEDNANHWAVIIDVKQPALKYTSLWLEYGQYDAGFATRSGSSVAYYGDYHGANNILGYDTTYYRLALTQEWNEKWATHLFYYGYTFADAKDLGNNKTDDLGPSEVGAGVQYKFNDSTAMGLNFIHYEPDDDDADADNMIRFRTKVTF